MTVTIGRRELLVALGGAAAAWPLAAQGQQGERIGRIAVLNNLAESDQDTQAWIGAFRRRLESLGWSEGRNLKIDIRWGAGDLGRLRDHAADLVSMRPNVAFADARACVLCQKTIAATQMARHYILCLEAVRRHRSC